MNEDSDTWHIIAAGLAGVLSLAFTLWAWVVNKASGELLAEIRSMRVQIDINSQRISRLEGRANGEHERHS